MDNQKIFSHVDHTALKATTSLEEIKVLCQQSLEYKTASVCIPSYYVSKTKELFPTINICTVIGFPLGYTPTSIKVQEATTAIADGANEVDMVVNLCAIKNGDFDYVKNEIQEIKKACGNKILKVIIETCYLTEQEKITLCKIVTEAGADYIKTSTGFGTAGATPEDIAVFKNNIGENIKMKAAGGIRSKQDMEQYIEQGCDRLGTSSAIDILVGKGANGAY